MRTVATRRDVGIIGLIGVMLGTILGAVLMASGTAGAGNGDPLIVGAKTNGTRTTKLIGRHGLEIRASKSQALKLYTQPGVAPMTVNQTAKVEYLNADEVDGRSANQIKAEWAGCSNQDIGDGADWVCQASLDTPVPGAILVSGSVDVYNATATGDQVYCDIYIDDSYVAGSDRDVYVQAGNGDLEVCATDAYLQGVSAGSHTIDLRVESVAAFVQLGQGAVWAIFVPD
jgi:hypothetical protein